MDPFALTEEELPVEVTRERALAGVLLAAPHRGSDTLTRTMPANPKKTASPRG